MSIGDSNARYSGLQIHHRVGPKSPPPDLALGRKIPSVGRQPRPRASEKGIEYVDPSVVDRVKGMPPLDKGEDQ